MKQEQKQIRAGSGPLRGHETRGSNFVAALRAVVRRRAEEPAFTFLMGGEVECPPLSYVDLERRVRAVAVQLRTIAEPGDRALLLYPPGAGFVTAFLGCLWAGVVAVPTFPPRRGREDRRLGGIARDARPSVVLTESALASAMPAGIRVLPTDDAGTADADRWRPPELTAETPAFLQYTSGSTAAPKGVIVTHGNLVHNQEMIREVCAHDEESVTVSWLPPYHDMGLIAGILQPLYVGGRCVLMSPAAFLQKPVRWLDAMTRYRGTTSGGPNFAYDLCVRKVKPEDRKRLDLSGWHVAFNGAEPVRADTIERFARVFSRCGFDRRAAYPCYGLAEATLYVTGGDRGQEPAVEWFDPDALERHEAAPVSGTRQRILVSCGRPRMGQELRIVDPESRTERPPDRVGEIWVAGPSVAPGYWQNPEQTARDFGARLADDETAGPFLRTGDLGFLWDGELFVTGRLKDLIIIRGRNHYPQDLELTAVNAHPTLRPGGGAAFSVDTEERLVVVHELRRSVEPDLDEVSDAVRRAVTEEHEVHVHEVVLISAGTLPKTSSGKVQRRACRTAWQAGELRVVGTSEAAAPVAAVAVPVLDRKELLLLPAAERGARLLDFLRGRLAAVVESTPEKLDPEQPLTALGLDSLRAVELASEVEDRLGAGPSQARLLAGATLREVAAEVLTAIESGTERSPIPPAPQANRHPLSAGQRSLWLVEELNPNTTAYALNGALRFEDEIDAARLQQALDRLVARHPALRTTIDVDDGEPYQVVHDAMPVDRPPFSIDLLDDGKLLRLSIHHLISDLWSIGVLLEELDALYRDPEAELPPLPVRYVDYVHWQAAQPIDELGAYWQKQLREPAPLDLPMDRPRPTEPTMAGGLVFSQLDGELIAAVDALGPTRFMTLAATFQVLLHRHTGQDNVLLGTPTTGRNRPELHGLIGYFVNPVVLRGELAGDPPFDAFLETTRRKVLAAFARQDYPFPLLRLTLQAMLVYQQTRDPRLAAASLGAAGAELELFGQRCETVALPCRDAQIDLMLYAAPSADGLALALEYAVELLDATTIRRLLGHFGTLLRGIATEPGKRISELPLLTTAEEAQLLVEWNDSAATGPFVETLPHLLATRAAEDAERVAVTAGGENVTRGELDERASRLAGHLRGLGVRAETPVGVCVDQPLAQLVAVLAVLRAGGCYLPLDPAYPRDRLAFMVEDAGARLVVTTEQLADELPDLFVEARPVLPDGAAAADPVPPAVIASGQLAYTIYTSGSTGKPKGVGISHGALLSFLGSMAAKPGLAADDVLLAVTSLSFDIAGLELYLPLLTGARLVLAGRDEVADGHRLRDLIVREGVTVVQGTPATWRLLVAAGWQEPLTVLCGGEAMPPDLAAALRQRSGAVWNLYGPTETTVWSAVCRVDRPGAITVGRPIANTSIVLLDRSWRPVPIGGAGEMVIGGAGVARGYRGRPALTAERFVPDPLSSVGGARRYRTGDLARRLADGRVVYLGRLDHQVKIRGFRIELGEIEAALSARPGVREAAVVAVGGDAELATGTRLAAFVTCEDRAAVPDLRGELPEHMVPATCIVLDEMPRTPNGKTDRRALMRQAETAVTGASNGRFVAPRTPAEQILAGIWTEVLGRVERIGAHDRFFALGGHSLLATQVLSRVREAFGVELSVRTVFEAPALASLAARIEASTGPARRRLPPPERVGRASPLPLSLAQQRLWFLSQLEPDSPYYNLAAAGRLRGALAVEPLRRAVGEIVRRHEALRTTFVQDSGKPVQVIAAPSEPAVPVVDLTALTTPGREQVLTRLLQEEARRPFDLGRGSLLRVGLVRITPEDHGVWLTMHHIVSDGWSLGVFFRELSVLYESFAAGRPSPLPELAVQYADFACWQRRILDEDVLASELSYWRRKLAGAPAVLELPADRPRPAVQRLDGATCELRLPAEMVTALQELGRQRGVTLFMTLLSGFQLLLSRYSGQDDVVVGFPVANRNRVEIEPLIGFFVNTLVLRTDLSGNPAFSELLTRVRGEVLDAWAHQEVPFERLVEELAPERNLAYTPLFQVVLGLQNAPWETPRLRGLSFQPRAVGTGTSKFDLTLLLEERGGALAGTLEYATALFDGTTVRRLLGHFRNLLSTAAAGPDERVAALSLMSAGERAQLLVEWPDTNRPYPRETTVQALFEDQAARTPEAVAVVFGEQELSYRELNQRANRLAHHLRTLGVGPEVPVAVFMERSPEMVVAILGVLKAGGFYLPLDTGYPLERLAFMLDDVRVGVLLAQERLLSSLPDHAAQVVCVDRDQADVVPRTGENPPARGTAENLCYVMHTSGSTGRPKGVAVSHHAVVRLVRENDFASFGADEVFLQFAPISFDAATLEIWGALLNGGRLVVFPPGVPSLEELGEVIERHRVSTLWLTAGLFHQMVEAHLPRLRKVRQLLAGGDVLSVQHVRKVCRELPSVRLVNGYGPTENTTFTCCQPLAQADAERSSVPIGRPIAQTAVHLVDRGCRPVPIGVPGELWITGDGLARSYFSRPGLTAARFVPDPAGWGRAYRTGDLARWLPDGRIEFLGRIDTQVKVRGFRIELGEIEVLLREHPAVCDAVVLLYGEGAEQKRLVAYVVGHGEVQPDELREMLRARVPEYMVPPVFMMLEELPLSPNGKVDRRALPAPQWEGERAGYSPPRTPVEELLAGIWAEVLGLDRIGIDEDFFEVGGHSLLATRVISRLGHTFRVELPLRALFEATTIAELAIRIEATRRQRATEPPLASASRDPGIPYTARLSFAQEQLWFLDQLDPGTAQYNICGGVRLRGMLDVDRFHASVNQIVRRHDTLRTNFLHGDEGRPVQRIVPGASLALPLVDLGSLSAGGQEAELRRLAADEARRPFDMARGPLLRLLLLRLGADETVAVLNMHHIISDGWSLGIFMRELGTFYAGAALAPLPVRYADYVAWQRQWLSGEVLASELAHWRQRLAGAPEVFELPADRPRPPVMTYRGAALPVLLDRGRTVALQALGQRCGTTLYMTVLAAFQTLLARQTGQYDIPVGSPVAGRGPLEIEPLIGLFVNTLVMRGDLTGDPPFAQLLERVRELCLDAWAHQSLPFEKLVEELRPERSMAHSPLFQVVLSLRTDSEWQLDLPAVEVLPLAMETGTTRFDLELLLAAAGDGVSGQLHYSRDLFDATTIRRLVDHLYRLLAAVSREPGRCLSQLPLLSAAEHQQLLCEWNDTDSPPPRQACLHELFAAAARRTPQAVALEWTDGTMTYAELDRRSDRLARRLRRLVVGPEVPVGLWLEERHAVVTGILAILKAGGAYVPLDRSYPANLVKFMAADCGLAAVVSSEQSAATLPVSNLPVVYVDAEDDDPEPCDRDSAADHLAYVMYTSGSTGRPKGVEVTHRNVVRLVREADYARLAADQVFLQLAPVSFDASTLEIWGALANGARLVCAPPEALSLAEVGSLIRRHRVTILWLTAGLFHQMVDEGLSDLAGLEQLLAGGDVLSPDHVRRALGELPGCTLVNGYGPTENTTFTCCHRMTGSEEVTSPVAVGRPIADTRVWVVDRHQRPVPVGVVGELLAGGDGLARGYRRRPALTAERFLPNPFSWRPGERLYRTGDLVRQRRDGILDFIGRVDFQVKIRGFRIEPGEIENVLVRHDAVREAVVLAEERGAESGNRELRLVAFLAPERATAVVGELRDFLRTALPDYMVPSSMVVLDQIPLTPNGKVDRTALLARAASEEQEPGGEEYIAPRNDVERILAGLWADILGVERVSITDNFFELGGHSLLATQLVSRLAQSLAVNLPVRAVFEAPTITRLVRRIRSETWRGTTGQIPRQSRGGNLPLSFAQERLWFLDRLEPNTATYNLPISIRLRGHFHMAAMAASLNEVMRRHEALRTTFYEKSGHPFQLIGPFIPRSWPVVDLDRLPEPIRKLERQRLMTQEAAKPFDLSQGPLLRACMVRLAEGEWVLLLTLHHIIADGWSIHVLIQELAALYDASLGDRQPPLPELPVQYADYAVWQRHCLRDETLQRQLTWWRESLAGFPAALNLPIDHPRPTFQTFRGAYRSLVLSPDLSKQLRTLGRRHGVTPFMTLMAVFRVLLARLGGSRDLVVGAAIAGRTRAEIEPLVGLFINTLALRVNMAEVSTFRELLMREREVHLGSFTHQDLPFEKLLEVLRPERDLSHTPLFKVFFNMVDFPQKCIEMAGLELELLDPPELPSKFDLTIYTSDRLAGISMKWVYNVDLFDAVRIAEMQAQYLLLLEQVAQDFERPLDEFSLVTEAARAIIPNRQRIPSKNWIGSVHQIFSRSAERVPERLAVVDPQVRWTYDVLERRSNCLAHYLLNSGLERGEVVAIHAHRSAVLVWAILGVMKAGGAFLILDPACPPARQVRCLEQARPRVFLQIVAPGPMPGELVKWLEEHGSCTHLELTGAEMSPVVAAFPDTNPALPVTADDVAYIAFTSASTGTPKGIVGRHGPLSHFLPWYREILDLTADDRFSMLSGLGHDPLHRDLFLPLQVGAAIYIPDSLDLHNAGRLAPWLERNKITIANLTPAVAQGLAHGLAQGFRIHSLRYVLFAGDHLTGRTVVQLRDLAPEASCINLYGTTETQQALGYYRIPSDGMSVEGRLPVGQGLPDVQLLVLTRQGRPAGIGELGEIYFRSPHLARCYLADPVLTASRFVPDTRDGGRIYRTGDLGRYRPDGALDLFGRADTQINLRGFRIEPAEIEMILGRHPAIGEAAIGEVTIPNRGDSTTQQQLVAYYVPQPLRTVTASELRTYLQRYLPAVMVPSVYVRLERLPLSANGKIDRRALSEIAAAKPENDTDYVAPQSTLERILAAIWCEVLPVERVGVHDNFFELGGHSLLLLELQAHLAEELRREVEVVALFQYPTIHALARHLEREEPAQPDFESSRNLALARREWIRRRSLHPVRKVKEEDSL